MTALSCTRYVFVVLCVLAVFWVGCESYQVPVYQTDIALRPQNHFCIIGDTQRTSVWERVFLFREQNDQQRSALVQAVARQSPGSVVLLGDLVFSGGSSRHWQRLDELLSPVLARGIPAIPLLGNHEYYGFDRAAHRNFRRRFPGLGAQTWYTREFLTHHTSPSESLADTTARRDPTDRATCRGDHRSGSYRSRRAAWHPQRSVLLVTLPNPRWRRRGGG